MPRPLAGLRVLDLSRVLAGPWCTQILADLGAEVIKVERPGSGDDTRGWGPPFLRDGQGNETGDSAYFLSVNRGKKSVAIDLSRPEGQSAVKVLAAKCDVLVENYRVGQLVKYGLDFKSIEAMNPGLIYCSITGFGQDGPYASRPGYDFVAQAIGGLMSVTGERDDRPGGGPQKVGVAVADIMTGMYATVAILAALNERSRTGRGRHIDANLLDTQVAMLAPLDLNYLVSGVVPCRAGNAHQNIVPYQLFDALDGKIVLAVGNDGQFVRFCEIAGSPALAADPRFATNESRVRNRAALLPILRSILQTRSRRDWQTVLDAAGIPVGAVNSIDEVFADPHVRHRKMLCDLPHPRSGRVPGIAHPVRYSDEQVMSDLPPPLLGQHTREVLESLAGCIPEDIERMESQGIVHSCKELSQA